MGRGWENFSVFLSLFLVKFGLSPTLAFLGGASSMYKKVQRELKR